jgi:putative transposase
MKKQSFTEEQILGFLKAGEAGTPVKELCRKHGFSDAAYYTWRKKYGGLSVSEAKRLRELEAENSKLRKLLAESMLNTEALRTALSRKY